jgi:RNA polymerase sigma-70 factor (ECF subfamily)
MRTNTTALYLEYKPLLSSIAYRMLGTLTDAEDVVQEVFADLETKRVDQILNVRAYLLKMVTNNT